MQYKKKNSFKELSFTLILSKKFKEVLYNKNGSTKASFDKRIFEILSLKQSKNVNSEIQVIK